ncbi:MAG: DUF6940 family protein [Planctomycetota bacterium]
MNAGRTRRVVILRDNRPLPYADVLDFWKGNEAFRVYFIDLLADVPFRAYTWETPPITETTVSRAFEFVQVDYPHLDDVPPDPSAFESYFGSAAASEWIVAFPNLGHDAYLVAPCPRAPDTTYPHLAAFTKAAPEAQQHALWHGVAEAVEQRLHGQPIWLSTAGGGVSWLHVRLDSHPKYYRFDPYRAAALL